MTITIFGRGGGKRRGGGGLFAPLRRRTGTRGAKAAPPKPRDHDALRLMSLNIAHARRKAQHQSLLGEPTIRRNLALIAGVIERESPHVVALQEADGPSSWSGKIDHVETISSLAGYAHTFRGEHSHPSLARLDLSYGTALLSRLPLDAPRSHAFQQNWRDTKGFVAATISSDILSGESVDDVSIHLDFLADRVRRRQVEQLVDRFRGHSRHLVVMGDFNATDDNPTVQYLTGRTARASDVETAPPSPALVDTFRLMHPSATGIGTLHRWSGRTSGRKVDYIFVPAAPASEVLDSAILHARRGGRYPSDHFPVRARVWLAAPRN